MGTEDLRLNSSKKIDFRIVCMINSWKKKDPPPNRVKPIPIQVIRTIQFVAGNSADLALKRTAHMIVLAFFFLLRALAIIQHPPVTPNPSIFEAFNSFSVVAASTLPPPQMHNFIVQLLLP